MGMIELVQEVNIECIWMEEETAGKWKRKGEIQHYRST